MTVLSDHRGWDQPAGTDGLPRWRRLLPAEVLSTTAMRNPDAIATRSAGGGAWTWAEIDSAADRTGNALLARGLRPGDVVGVRSGNEPETLALMYGILRAGLVQLPLNPRYTEAEVDHQVRRAEAAAVVGPGGLDLTELIAAGRDAPPDVDVQEHEPAHLRFSAGTTGRPKMFFFTNRALALLHQHIAAELRYQGDDVALVNAPLAHAAFHLAAAAVSVGATIMLQPQFQPATVWQECDEAGITQVFMVPTMLALALDSPGSGSTIRGIAVSASAFPEAIKSRIVARFPQADVTELYGASELGFVTALRGAEWAEHRGSVGLPRFGYRVRILGPDGSDLPTGEIGDIYVQGPAMSEGHIGEAPGALPVHDGWASAGDLGRLDAQGYLHIADRRSDLIISGGNNIYPAEVENVLLQVPGVREVAVIGLPDQVWGAKVVAVVVAAADVSAEVLDTHTTRQLARYKRPREYHFVQELPVSSTGKILRRVVRDQFAPVVKSP